jgi:hypothetical protein
MLRVLRLEILAQRPDGTWELMHSYSSNQQYFDFPTFFKNISRLWDKHGERVAVTIVDRDRHTAECLQQLCDSIADERRHAEKANKTYIFVDMYETFDVPKSVAVCPYCQAALTAKAWEWEEESEGVWTAMSIEVDCDDEPDMDSDEFNGWVQTHLQSPYDYWLPMLEDVEQWINEHFRFKEDRSICH